MALTQKAASLSAFVTGLVAASQKFESHTDPRVQKLAQDINALIDDIPAALPVLAVDGANAILDHVPGGDLIKPLVDPLVSGGVELAEHYLTPYVDRFLGLTPPGS